MVHIITKVGIAVWIDFVHHVLALGILIWRADLVYNDMQSDKQQLKLSKTEYEILAAFITIGIAIHAYMITATAQLYLAIPEDVLPETALKRVKYWRAVQVAYIILHIMVLIYCILTSNINGVLAALSMAVSIELVSVVGEFVSLLEGVVRYRIYKVEGLQGMDTVPVIPDRISC